MEMLKLQVAFGNASMTTKEKFIFYNFYLIQDSKELARKMWDNFTGWNEFVFDDETQILQCSNILSWPAVIFIVKQYKMPNGGKKICQYSNVKK